MALFGKSDASVPILTAFYQASLPISYEPIGGDLDVLMYRYLCREPHALYLWSDKREEAPPILEKALQGLSYYHTLIKAAMDAAADKTFLPGRDTFSLNCLIKEKLTPPQVRFGDTISPVIWYQNVPLLELTDTPGEDVDRFLSAALTQFVRAVEQQAFLRCAECGSVFVSTQKARFCSERDRARYGMRRRRQGGDVSAYCKKGINNGKMKLKIS